MKTLQTIGFITIAMLALAGFGVAIGELVMWVDRILGIMPAFFIAVLASVGFSAPVVAVMWRSS